ncbi:hypothetical protein AAGG74_15105 [Bacillus mexicanus]|uniref:hypothetical protein n=1 Tax=Bacillus mexicanus TaxID=2834415 RepID=UPI003D1C3AF9
MNKSEEMNLNNAEKMNFNYDPLQLVRLALSQYVSDLKEKEITKATQLARNAYLREMTDDELEELLHRLVEEQNLEAITLKEWKKDCKFLLSYIYETERYKELEFKYKKQGYGTTGLGVVDTSDNTFYDCEFAGHWETIIKVISNKYPQYIEAVQKMQLYSDINEYKGITRNEVDQFILKRFELVGGSKQLEEYTSSKKS